MSQPIATDPTVEADALTFDQGDTSDNPKPAPSGCMNDNAAATKAPPMTAPP
jgi:hypothetical protein